MTQWAQPPQRREQLVLFEQRLDEALPAEHSVRLLDDILAQLDWSAWEARYHPTRGQPAIHPRVPAGVLLYGLLTRIRSSRGLEDALQVRLDFRWLAEGRSIDHTTLSEFRRKHAEELKDLFVQVVLLARRLKLLSLERVGFDATRVRANNRRTGTRTPEQLRQERDQLAVKFEEFAQQAAAEDAQDEQWFESGSSHPVPAELRDAQRRREQIDATLQELAQAQAAGRAVPKRVPITDPESRMMPNKDGGCAPNYTPLATVDIDSGLIVAADVLNVVNEDGQLVPAVEQVQRQFDLPAPPEVLTDGLNGTGANLAACAERGISIVSPCEVPDPASNPALRSDPTQPVAEADWDRLPEHPRKGDVPQLDKSAFVYDEQRDCYWCPLGRPLAYRHTTSEASGSGRRIRARYQAEPAACGSCPLRARCLHGQRTQSRSITREQHEGHRERHARKMSTPEAQATYALRRHPGERPFAVIKQVFGVRQFLMRGLERVRTEWRWSAMAFNLQRLLSLIRSRAGPPEAALAVDSC
jgi:transposase